MRIIITGGTGLIGKALANRMAAKGHEVIILSRSAPGKNAPLPTGIQQVQWDGKTARGWGDLVNSQSAIVNLAGENLSAGRWTAERKARILSSRVNAGKAVSEAVAQAVEKPLVVVQASAVGFYGSQENGDITEDQGPGSDFLSQVCIDWENSTKDVEAHGVRRPIIRTGVVLDRQSGALPKMALPFYFFAGGPIGSGRQWFPWIHLEDEVSAIEFLIENPSAHGPYNLNAPAPLTNRQFAQAIGKAIKRPSWFPLPAFVLRLALGEMSAVLLEGQKTLPKRLAELGFSFRYPEAEPALAALLK